MTEKRGKTAQPMRGRRRGTGRSLNLILWLLFSLFALVGIVVCVLLQNIFVGRNYRDQAFYTLKTAKKRIVSVIGENADGTEAAESAISSIAYEMGVNAYLIYDDTSSVVAYYGAERDYQEFSALPGLLADSPQEATFVSETEFVCAAAVTFGGRACSLYLSVSFAPLLAYESAFRWVSVVTGLVAVVLSFAASAVAANLVIKPIAEVTARAKEFARGNYDLNFREDYFYSEIGELSSALEYARVEISKADKMQKELIANVSHDFKTPLTMIKAYASMIREISGEDREKRNAHAQVIIDETDRLTALVNDVLDLSKLRAGVEEKRETFDLSEETRAIAARFDYLRETQNYVIETVVEDGIFIEAMRERIGQVVYNLIGNAVNYTGEEKRVRVKLFRKEGAARLEVIDSGKGIPPEERDGIWDRYYRSEQTHKRPVKGTGLGLSIVKSVLLAHGFRFGVVSELGKGSCFWVEFPFAGEKKEPAKSGKGDRT